MAKVLIIDDSKTAIAVVQAMLEKHGHQVLSADSGEAGLQIAASEHPDLILMDLAMPGMGGFQATRRLVHLDATRDIPVVVLSSKDQESDKFWARKQGARDYLVKPASEQQLVGTIDQMLMAG